MLHHVPPQTAPDDSLVWFAPDSLSYGVHGQVYVPDWVASVVRPQCCRSGRRRPTCTKGVIRYENFFLQEQLLGDKLCRLHLWSKGVIRVVYCLIRQGLSGRPREAQIVVSRDTILYPWCFCTGGTR